MSDTITCPNCSATVPAAASFCTSCGNRLGAGTPPPAPMSDPTRVESPGAHDATQVYAAPSPPPPSGTQPGPWQPAGPETTGSWGATAPPPAAPPTTQTPAWGPPPSATPPGPPPAPTSGAQAWQPGPAKPAKPSHGSPIGAALAVLGGVLTAVGIFLPWVKSNLSDAGLSGWDLTSGDKGFRLPDQSLLTFESLDPYAILALAVVGIVAGAMALGGGTRSLSRIVGGVVGIAVIGFMIRDWTSLASVVSDKAPADFKVESAVGFYLAIAGGALLVVSAFMPSKSSDL